MKPSRRILIVGAGITGIVLAERLSRSGNEVVLIEKRGHVGGNCYDCEDGNGILVHRYGPHIFHTDSDEVWEYLSLFTEWNDYEHKILGFIDGKYVPIPFNLNSLKCLFSPVEANILEDRLIAFFGAGSRVPILELLKIDDIHLKRLANFIYEKVFLHYNEKQWGLRPEQIDYAVSGRVPVVISRDDRCFQDKYQAMPTDGYAGMFEKMLDRKNILIKLETDYGALAGREKFDATFYTGPVDSFFGYEFGKLDYRSVSIDFKTFNREHFQAAPVVNYPNDYDFTRSAEFKKMTGQKNKKTVVGFEYPGTEGFMAYPVFDGKNKTIYAKYEREARALEARGIFFVGRLAEYRYYDMDDAVKNALHLSKKSINHHG